MSSSLTRVIYDDLELGKEYYVKKDGILYKGIYYCHYRGDFDNSYPLTFINVTPNPENKKLIEFNRTDEMYKNL